MSDFICPFCFSKMDAKRVYFQCENARCQYPDVKRAAFLRDIPEEQLSENRVEKSATVFWTRAPGSLARRFGAKEPQNAKCPRCGVNSSVRACPECHSSFPSGVDSLSNMVVAIVGAKETGKSHYIAVLIQRIRQLYKSFGWTLSALDDETMNRYKTQFYNPLFITQPARTLDVTQSARANAAVKSPLLYSLNLPVGNGYRTITLAFFDAAGEDLDDERQMRVVNRYIFNASGIVLLIDPLQFPNVRAQFHTGNLPRSNNAYGGDVVNRIANLIRNNTEISRVQKIQTPLAVALSKIDMMRPVVGDDSPVFQQSRHRQGFDVREFASVDGHIRDWIDYWDERQTLIQQTLDYSDVGFFGISSLGGNPSVEGYLPFAPRPLRVEDPFLWILWKNGLVPSR